MENLPEKWAIKRTKENDSTVTKWLIKNISADHTYNNLGFPYAHIKPGQNYPKTRNGLVEGYTEISFKDFKRLVLKENNTDVLFIFN